MPFAATVHLADNARLGHLYAQALRSWLYLLILRFNPH
jgi:hypothetical protein